ncbi:cytochrome P450 [Clavulina sp. PMI_390]|nr:cytochrome P450 [Clavulina sp. PMI_390]
MSSLTAVSDNWRSLLALAIGGYLLYQLKQLFDCTIRASWHLRNVPGPPHQTYMLGNFGMLTSRPPGLGYKDWHDKYGKVVLWRGFFSLPRVSITDKKALNHILVQQPYEFPKSPFDRRLLASFLGHGLFVADGNDHKRQRRVMNPAFGSIHMKAMYPMFLAKAQKFRDLSLNLIEQSSESPQRASIDLVKHTMKVTLDVIGAAGFDYDIGAIEGGEQNELMRAFNTLFATNRTLPFFILLRRMFPLFDTLVPDRTQMTRDRKNALETMTRIGKRIVAEKGAAIRAGISSLDGSKSSSVGKDLISLLLKANMDEELKPSQRLSDDEVAAQITTFLLVGNETTATAINWSIYGMLKYPHVQDALRAEILSLGTDSPSFNELNDLKYLDAVVRETLRIYPPTVGTSRLVAKDCVVPLEAPIVDKSGRTITELFLPRDSIVDISTATLNLDETVWGPDAAEFRPERWLVNDGEEKSATGKLPEGAFQMPSLASSTFLAGPRSCIGFRLAMIEMKVVLFALIQSIKFESAVPIEDIESNIFIVTFPQVKTQRQKGAHLPVFISRV